MLVDGDGPDPGRLLGELGRLERRWSRFRSDSEISRLGAAAGRPTVVSGETALLVSLAVHASRRTDGRFDPTVLPSMISNGYDRDLDLLDGVVATTSTGPAPGVEGIETNLTTGLVWMPSEVGIDPGGIGKGLAADLVAAMAVTDDVTGVLVDVGGDLRVAGSPPVDGWEIGVDHGDGPVAVVNLRTGAVATSSVRRRRWRTAGGVVHHVLDPRTGTPSAGPFVAVSVAASTAWWAEVVATALLVDPTAELDDPGAPLLDGVAVLATDVTGHVHGFGPRTGVFEAIVTPGRRDQLVDSRCRPPGRSS